VAFTEVAWVDEAVGDLIAALTVAECFEFDSVLAGVAVGSGAEVVGAVLDFGSVSTGLVVLVCAPPLLLTVTPEPTSVLDDVVPDGFVAPAAVVSVAVEVDPLAEVAPLPVAVEGVDPVASLVEVEPVALVELVDDSEDVGVVSAAATP
jgi:hypothetical protein